MADAAAEAGKGLRFILNGIAATATHYAGLMMLTELVGLRPVGLMNLLAATLGVAVSYLGNHYIVFRSHRRPHDTVGRFLAVYGLSTVLHGLCMGLWADVAGWPTTPGFVLITGLTAAANFVVGRLWVFDGADRAPGSPRD